MAYYLLWYFLQLELEKGGRMHQTSEVLILDNEQLRCRVLTRLMPADLHAVVAPTVVFELVKGCGRWSHDYFHGCG